MEGLYSERIRRVSPDDGRCSSKREEEGHRWRRGVTGHGGCSRKIEWNTEAHSLS